MPRRDFSKVPFAATGDMNSVPTEAQADGSVSLAQGFTYDYERDNGAGGGTPDPLAKNIGREDTNGILNEITASIGEIQKNGVAIWAATAAPYPINAQVRHLDKVWRSTIANNNSTPGANSDWEVSGLQAGRLLRTLVITASGTYTPLADTSFIIVEQCGGGGGSAHTPATGASQVSSTGGAGAGAYAKARFQRADVAGGVPCTIGTGGAGGIAANSTPSTDGGATSFGALVFTAGGARSKVTPATATGVTNLSTFGLGGLQVTGGQVFAFKFGEPGTPGWNSQDGNAIGGTGGSTPLGAGGAGAGQAPSVQGSGYGGGGGGSVNAASQAGRNGANGANGVIMIWEYA